jgi:deazaflavin-dependent oxidoreductase (nitroreductase family)
MSSNNPMHAFTEALVNDLRANGGRATKGPFVDKPLLLLTTTGARTGQKHTAPLAFTRDGDRVIIIASMGGAPSHPSWFHNLQAHGRATIEVEGETYDVRPSVIHGAERRRLYDAQAEIIPSFKEYEARTTREIPVIALERIRPDHSAA